MCTGPRKLSYDVHSETLLPQSIICVLGCGHLTSYGPAVLSHSQHTPLISHVHRAS